jgi:hypothetical protein
MPTPSRETVAGRVYNDLRNLARRAGRGTDELLVGYALERFLYRLSLERSPRFVLEGGLLLATFGARRPTRDIDLLATDLPNDQESVRDQVVAVARVEADDGVVFDIEAVRVTKIREDADYFGVRAILPASIARARLRVGIDINFGDPVTPAAKLIDFPQLLTGEPFGLLGYPIETVVAEKLCTAIVLADLNTRERDYADLYRLLGTHDITGAQARDALLNTAAFRGARLALLSDVLGNLAQRRQAAYMAWRRKQGPDAGAYPLLFADVVAAVVAFADPLISGEAQSMRWSGGECRWIRLSDEPSPAAGAARVQTVAERAGGDAA